MQRFAFSTLMAALMAAVLFRAGPTPARATATSGDAKPTVMRLFDAINAGDLAAYDELVAPD